MRIFIIDRVVFYWMDMFIFKEYFWFKLMFSVYFDYKIIINIFFWKIGNVSKIWWLVR